MNISHRMHTRTYAYTQSTPVCTAKFRMLGYNNVYAIAGNLAVPVYVCWFEYGRRIESAQWVSATKTESSTEVLKVKYVCVESVLAVAKQWLGHALSFSLPLFVDDNRASS